MAWGFVAGGMACIIVGFSWGAAKIAELAKVSSRERGSTVEKSGFALMPGSNTTDIDFLRRTSCVSAGSQDLTDYPAQRRSIAGRQRTPSPTPAARVGRPRLAFPAATVM